MQVCTSLQTDNHASTPPLSFLQSGCSSCRPANSVKALKACLIVVWSICAQNTSVSNKSRRCFDGDIQLLRLICVWTDIIRLVVAASRWGYSQEHYTIQTCWWYNSTSVWSDSDVASACWPICRRTNSQPLQRVYCRHRWTWRQAQISRFWPGLFACLRC